MIVVDASAILAAYVDEADAGSHREAIERAGGAVISPVNFWELLVNADRVNEQHGSQEAEVLLEDLAIEISHR